MDHPAATVPDLPKGPGRPCPGEALLGHPVGVLGLLDCTCCNSTTASICYVCSAHATVLCYGSPSPGPSGGGGGVVVGVAVAEGDVVEVLAVGAPLLRRQPEVLPSPPFTTPGPGASPYGPSRLPMASLAHRPPCSLVLWGSTQRPCGLHLPAPRPGRPVGTKRPWRAPSALWA